MTSAIFMICDSSFGPTPQQTSHMDSFNCILYSSIAQQKYKRFQPCCDFPWRSQSQLRHWPMASLPRWPGLSGNGAIEIAMIWGRSEQFDEKSTFGVLTNPTTDLTGPRE